MPVVLARIDDRLIHGQVTAGWSPRVRPTHIILANNDVAADAWQSRVYTSSVPPGIETSVLSIAAAAAALNRGDCGNGRAILLTASPGEMAELVRAGVPLARINLGGVHYKAGRIEMLPWVYVDAQDVVALRRLLDAGVEVNAQQVPGGREVDVDEALLARTEGRL